mmetsp:Transcript_31102/g.66216  ORF Transcript_31102/g.66216 Transcript_31102/m.66216 type:complete len:236 (+) Transcript_31102:208-915(+)|eukprot:CAMPEP_0172570218 /NCGR_PEP_ID=MMETSP1067-20121228/126693_1 /TAXON_ID=265564 ORGANISM="Thalassiosira punctigera, Strain Tpunct2005C2" /NCGR_SAMPLE_ID=MMETSP1067 /ASSEMBLY_ACC=CAM_ASM_000444 /LENGTH=235 /DNA_ID=CAMNT_0013362265 /DNA_START=192 /DNA_END=899 /DNA_ORIENTATION=-
MPTIAKSAQVKRHLLLVGDEQNLNKRQRVRFEDDVEVHISDRSVEQCESVNKGEHEADEDVEFAFSIGEDGDWDYSITTNADSVSIPTAEELETDVPPSKRIRSPSPFAGCDHRLCGEPSTVSHPNPCNGEEDDEWSLCRVDSNNSLGNNLKISLKACNDAHDLGASAEAAMPTPLITPPSSPRRVQTFSGDGMTSEEATICEWPCNLTVDNAITAALELAPLSLPLGTPNGDYL